ncbi:transglycosylase SLT domain-containing protein [uncultured Roseovarius sp.]|uniref:transglycosylase SLT domain-containing protein n=1 Tax=uncultured Roseovarius sp. TaxID=293344 RepID=UPI0026177B3B|nr:transglycosylase SLT domain-containing protein [uncultured Roseovarius sp.]
MSRTLRALLVLFVLASCGGGTGYGTAPRNLDHACAILEERPEYARAFRAAERRWGVPPHVMMATIHQESKFISDARTPFRWTLGVIPTGRISSAYGYSQALDGTWDEYRRETNRFGSRRSDIHDAADFIGWYMAKSNERLGISMNDARGQYLAYHEGRTGYSRGSYNGKPWLLRVANNVESRAQTYRAQLGTCRIGRRLT